MAIIGFGRNINTVIFNHKPYRIVRCIHNGITKDLFSPLFNYELSADGTYYTISPSRNFTGEVVIRGSLEGVPVLRIAGFQDQQNLTKLTFTGSDAIADDYSFSGCRNLQEVIGITSVGRYAFQNCYNLYSVRSPLTHLQEGSFYGCSALDNIIIDKLVGAIPVDCFNGCTSLTKIYYTGTENQWKNILIQSGNDVLNNVEIVYHDHSYSEWETIKNPGCATDGYKIRVCSECSAEMYNTISALGHAWGEWDITMEPTCTTLGSGRCYCPQCEIYNDRDIEPLGHDWSEWYTTKEVTETENGEDRRDCQREGCGIWEVEEISTVFQFELLNDGTYEISKRNNPSGDIVIPNTHKSIPVTQIKRSAFITCSELISVVIGDHVTTIGSSAFRSCSYITNVVIGDSVTTIANDAFNSCVSLATVVIGNSVTSIGDGAFVYCRELNKVYYKGTKTEWDAISIASGNTPLQHTATKYYYSETYPTTSGNYWHYVDGQVAEWGSECETCTWQEATCTTPRTCSVCGKKEGEPLGHIWSEWNTIKETTETEDGVKERTCSRCEEAESITIKSNGLVTSSNGLAFIPLEDSFYAVAAADGYISGTVIIPHESLGKAVIQIYEEGFLGCGDIGSVVLPNSITTIGERAFKYSSVEYINITDSVTSIGSECFYEAKKLREITFGENINLTEIPYGCFRYCDALKITEIPNGVTSIGNYAFNACAAIEELTISGSVVSIGEGAFQYCTNLSTVTIDEGCENIFGGAFHSCVKLKQVSIPASVKYIGYGVFADCHEDLEITVADGNTAYKVEGGCLIKIESNGSEVAYGNQNSEIPSDVNSIGSGAFYGGTYAAPIKIPLSVNTINSLAFQECENLVLHVEATSKPEEWADDWCDDSVTVVWGYKDHEYGGWTTTVKPTCTKFGSMERTCSRCGEVEFEAIEPLDHDYETVVTPPTCGEKGYTTYTCLRCDHSYKGNYVESTGIHSYATTGVVQPTCTTKGVITLTCNECGSTRTMDVQPVGHDWGSSVTTVQPTCTSEGRLEKTCKRCGDTEVTLIPPIGHTMIPPTCTEPAICGRCGVTEGDALGHNFVNNTCTRCGYTTTMTVYYGVSTIPERYNASFILGLENTMLSDKHLNSISVAPLKDEYIYYCVPTSFGDCTFAYNNFIGGFSLIVEGISVTNSVGKTEAYNIYKSNQANLGANGAITITITIKEMG